MIESSEPTEERPAQQSDERRGGESRRGSGGFHLYGIVRGRNFRGHRPAGAEMEAVQRVRYRDLEALVRPAAFAIDEADTSGVRDHQQVLETVMRRTTVLPAPFGLLFRSRRALVHFIEDQYLVLDEALAFLDGHWELRLHLELADSVEPDLAAVELGTHLYTELRRFARAAIPFPREEKRLLSAAFLVDRSTWIEFVERSDDLANTHPEINFDVTGPWPPYDFVRMTI